MRLLLLIGLAVISASLWHHFLARFWLASVTATVTTVVMFIFNMYSGWLDLGPRTLYINYFVLAEILHTDFLSAVLIFDVVSSSLLAFVVSALIGLIFRARRIRLRTEKYT
jgi:hypothetical protein